MREYKIANTRNIAFVLGRLRGGEKSRTELWAEFRAFCPGSTAKNFLDLITFMSFKVLLYESDDGRLGILGTGKNEGLQSYS